MWGDEILCLPRKQMDGCCGKSVGLETYALNIYVKLSMQKERMCCANRMMIIIPGDISPENSLES